MKYLLIVSLFSFTFSTLQAQQTGLVTYWTFDKINTSEKVIPKTRKGLPTPEIDRTYFVLEEKTSTKGQILGAFHKQVAGIVG